MNDQIQAFMDALKEAVPKPISLAGRRCFLVRREDFGRLYLLAEFPSLLDHWSGWIGTPAVWRHYDMFLIPCTLHWVATEHVLDREPAFALLHKQLEELGEKMEAA